MARIRKGRVPSEIEEEMLAAEVLSEVKEDTEIIQATRTRQFDWWGYGLE